MILKIAKEDQYIFLVLLFIANDHTQTAPIAKIMSPAPAREKPFSKKIGFGHVINVNEVPVFTFYFTDSEFHLRTTRKYHR